LKSDEIKNVLNAVHRKSRLAAAAENVSCFCTVSTPIASNPFHFLHPIFKLNIQYHGRNCKQDGLCFNWL